MGSFHELGFSKVFDDEVLEGCKNLYNQFEEIENLAQFVEKGIKGDSI